MLKLYNALTRTISEFIPIKQGEVKMYTCGPTVYSHAHVGNMRAYIFMDSMKRALKYNGYKVLDVMNITDVGHLVSDDDFGEDKMELAAKREQRSPYEISEYYTDLFLKDLHKLNIDMPAHITKATDYVAEMIDFVQILEQKGYTYKLDDGIYFDTKKFKEYGQLSRKDLDGNTKARIEENINKRHEYDFALWKFVEPSHIMKWDSPWGVGCPGWHIECSAMSHKILGEEFDIHLGGIDHRTVHHENEIAQNDAAMGHRVVRRFIHNEFLQADGGKMSKSLGNFYTITDLQEKGFAPMDFKYFCHNTHFSKKINLTLEALSAARTARLNLKQLLAEHKNAGSSNQKETLKNYRDEFLEAVNDNLNLPKALGIMWMMLKSANKSVDVYNAAIEFDKVFGLQLNQEEEQTQEEIPAEVLVLANERVQARKNKDFAQSDVLRGKIEAMGYTVKDTASGYEINKK